MLLEGVKKVMKIFHFALIAIFLSIPALKVHVQQNAKICVENKGDYFLDIFPWLGSHPMFEQQSDGRVTFGDGIRGSRPAGNAKHDKEGGHIVFGDGEHGVLTTLCGSVR
jgi:hypothetical protein